MNLFTNLCTLAGVRHEADEDSAAQTLCTKSLGGTQKFVLHYPLSLMY